MSAAKPVRGGMVNDIKFQATCAKLRDTPLSVAAIARALAVNHSTVTKALLRHDEARLLAKIEQTKARDARTVAAQKCDRLVRRGGDWRAKCDGQAHRCVCGIYKSDNRKGVRA